MIEIERKFLVTNQDFLNDVTESINIKQGWLSSTLLSSVRIRITDDIGFLTIKGARSASGTTCTEWETSLPLHEANELFEMCEPGVIEKVRHLVPVGKHTYEVDVFSGDNQGLVMAEIELSDEHEAFEKPSWLGEELTCDPRYINARLAKKPFTSW